MSGSANDDKSAIAVAIIDSCVPPVGAPNGPCAFLLALEETSLIAK